MAKDRKKLVHIHSKITDKQPRPEALEVGEIAVNNGVSGSTDRSFLSIKNADNKVVRFSSDEQMIFWTEKKEVIPFEGQVRGEDGPESTKDSGDYGSYGITNNDLLNNKSNLVIKFNQVAASNTPKSEKINGGKDIYNKLVNGTPDASREGAGIAIDMSRYAMRGANPSFSSLTITNDTTLEGDLNVNGNTKIGNGLNVTGATNINGATKITGDTTFNGNETVNGNLTVTGNTNVSGNTTIKGDTNISGNTRIDKNLTVSGNTNVSGDTNVGNNLKVTNGITADTVSATTSIKSPIISGTDITASNSVKADNVSANTITAATSVTTKDLNVSGNAKITGTTDIAGATTINNTLTVGSETLLKNTTVDGSLLVNSGATIHNGISVDGGANITGNTNLNGNLTVTGDTSLKATTATSISATSVTAPTISGTDITASNSVKANNVSANTITASTSVTTKDLDVSGNGKINNLSAGTLTVSGKTVFNGEVEFEEPIKFESACPQKITATTIGDAICEAFDRSVITIEKNTSPSDTSLATVYTIKQNGNTINTIEVAKDQFLKNAEVVKNTSGEWVIRLTWWIYDPDSGTHTTVTTDVNASELVKDLEAVNPDDNGTALNHNVKLTAWYDSTSGDMKISGETTPKMHVANITATTAMRANNVSANTISANTIYGSVVGGLSNSITFNTGNTNIQGSPFNGLNPCTVSIPEQFEHLKNYDGTKFNLSHPVSITGNVNVTGEITASGAIYSSDRDLKENIEFIGIDDINKIKNVPTRSFNFKDDTSKRKTYGVIAQEVQDANLNELVHVKDDGKLGVDYTSLYALKIAYLENMCNELNGKIVELENKINKLENKD